MKRILAVLLSAVMLLSVAGCGTPAKSSASASAPAESSTAPAAPAEATPAKEDLHFVYVSPLLAHPVWLLAKDGFDQACTELGIKGDWVGPQNISPEEMAKLIETAVAQKADAVITQGLVPAAPVKLAVDAGIPVLVVDSDIPDIDRLAFFGKDVAKQAEVILTSAEAKLGKDVPIKCSIQVAALNYKIATDNVK